VAAVVNGDRERRREPRRRSVADHGVVAVRIRPGIGAKLVDVSANGAQLETVYRMLPGRFVHVQFAFPTCTATVRGRVVRSCVSSVQVAEVAYRCGVRFDRRLHWVVQENGVRYAVIE
jgi:hypothetical protein